MQRMNITMTDMYSKKKKDAGLIDICKVKIDEIRNRQSADSAAFVVTYLNKKTFLYFYYCNLLISIDSSRLYANGLVRLQ